MAKVMRTPKKFVAEIAFEVFDKDTLLYKTVRRHGRRFKTTVDTEVDLFPVSVLAESIGRTIQTIILWEREGLFPAPMYVVPDTRKKRWYSRDQILGLARLMKRYNLIKKPYFDKHSFLTEVRSHFAKFDLGESV